MRLDIGELPAATEGLPEDADPQRIVKLTARAVARVADNFRFVRKLSRSLENPDARAGLLADVLAATYALAERNPEAVQQFARSFAGEMGQRRAARAASRNGNKPQTPEGVTPYAP